MAATPIWISLVSALLGGLFVLAGVLITAGLTAKREHRRWVLDHKKLEWRELVDTLHSCLWNLGYAFQPMRVYKPGEEGDVETAMQKGFRVIRDRIFIADAVERHQVLEQWKGLVAYVSTAMSPRDPGQHSGPTITEFNARGAAFEDKLLLMAREDLKL